MPKQSLASQVREANAAVRSGSRYAFAVLRPGQTDDEAYRLGGRRRIFAARIRKGRLQVQPLGSQRWFEAQHDEGLEITTR